MTSKEWGAAVWALFHSQPNVVPVATIEAIIADLAAMLAREAALREEMEMVATELERPTQPMIAHPFAYYGHMIRKRLAALAVKEGK